MARPSGSRTWGSRRPPPAGRGRATIRADHRELLRVLLAEVGARRAGRSRRASGRRWPRRGSARAGARPRAGAATGARRPRGRRSRAVHLRRARARTAASQPRRCAAAAVALEVARIAGEVLARAELRGVHEEAGRHLRRSRARARLDERQVARRAGSPWWGRGRGWPAARRRHSRTSRDRWRATSRAPAPRQRAGEARPRACASASSAVVDRRRDAERAGPRGTTAPLMASISVAAPAVQVLQHRGAVAAVRRGHREGERGRDRRRARCPRPRATAPPRGPPPPGRFASGGREQARRWCTPRSAESGLMRAVHGQLAPDVAVDVGRRPRSRSRRRSSAGQSRDRRGRPGVRRGRCRPEAADGAGPRSVAPRW